MAKRRSILQKLAFAVLIGLAGFWLMGGFRLTKSEVERRFAHDLPKGTPAAHVESYLKGRGLPYIWYDLERSYLTTLPETGGPPLMPTTFNIAIRMDESNRVDRVDMRAYWRGP